MKRLALFITIIACSMVNVFAQYPLIDYVQAEVDFSNKLRAWDGFGFNYVETCQTLDYDTNPQEYGGFSIISQADRDKVLDMVFGEDGLKVGLVKMFYGPFHQAKPGDPFDHEKATRYMRMFVREGYRMTLERGANLQIISTLYGPPGWATLQKVVRGRDIDPAQMENLAKYMASWAKFLKEEDKLPIKYLSIHNEGEDWMRWPADGVRATTSPGDDYNVFYSPQQIAEFMPILKTQLRAAGLNDVGVTPGETTNWYRFYFWGIAQVIAGDAKALDAMDLITSHGFLSADYGRWFGEHYSVGTDLLREKKPGLHAWVTSTSWSQMDARLLMEMHNNIYSAKVNAIIPWAGIQRPPQWVGGDPNPGSAFTVREDGTLEVRKGYYLYKQISRAGQPGMAVASTYSLSSEIILIAFSSNGTKHNDAFVLVNYGRRARKVEVSIKGTSSTNFAAFRTNQEEENYIDLGNFQPKGNKIEYDSPAGSVTTFFAK